MQHLHEDVLPEIGAIHEELEPPPRGFQLLELTVVQNLVRLGAESTVQFGDHAVDRDLLDLLIRVGRLEHLLDEGADAQPRRLIAFVLGIEIRLPDDLLKKRARALPLQGGILGLVHYGSP